MNYPHLSHTSSTAASVIYSLPLTPYHLCTYQNLFLTYLWLINVNLTGLQTQPTFPKLLRVGFKSSGRSKLKNSLFNSQVRLGTRRHSRYLGLYGRILKNPSLKKTLLSPRYVTPLSPVWKESFLIQLRSIDILGLKSNLLSQNVPMPLNSELKSFSSRFSSSADLPTKFQRISKSAVGAEKTSKLREYLSLRSVKISLKSASTSSPFVRSPVRAFTPRLPRKPLSKIPNPYLFLRLPHSYKPKKISVIDRFTASSALFGVDYSFGQYVTFGRSVHPKLKPVSGAPKISLRRLSGLKRRNLRFLKRQNIFSPKTSKMTKSRHLLVNNQQARLNSLSHFNPTGTSPDLRTCSKSTSYPSKNFFFMRTGLASGVLSSNVFSKLLSVLKVLVRRNPKSLQKLLTSTQLLQLRITRSSISLLRSIRPVIQNLTHSKLKTISKKAKNNRARSSLARAKIKILRFKYLAFCTTNPQPQLTPSLKKINRIANPSPLFKHHTPSVKNEALCKVDLLALPRWVYKLPKAIKHMKDSIPSLESLGFTRSPFYFLTYWTATRSSTLDLLGDHRPKYDAHSYVLFPEANAMKTAVFRKLTSQRLLAESRKPFLKQYAQKFYKKSFLAASSLTWGDKFSHRGLSVNRTSSSYMGFKDWLLTESIERHTQKYTPYIKPKRIRFKPGYGRMWRTARVSIREILDIKATYQYRLNAKLQTYYYQNRNQWKPERSLTIELVLMGAHYAPDRDAVYTLLTHNSVYLNGSTVSCNQLRIFTNDFIQLVVNLKFYITLRWLKSWAVVRQNRASKIFYRKYRPAPFNKNIKIVRELPRWFFDLESTYGDVPRCFEIDYFTLSAFVLPNTATAEEFTPTRSYMFDVNVLNMYNWKYIT